MVLDNLGNELYVGDTVAVIIRNSYGSKKARIYPGIVTRLTKQKIEVKYKLTTVSLEKTKLLIPEHVLKI